MGERDRRQRVVTYRLPRDQIPAQIADLTARFIEAGGDPADLG